MTFVRPTLTDLVSRARADLEARLPGADSRLPRSALDVLAVVHAGAIHGLYGMLDTRARFFPDPGNPEAIERWAAIKGLSRKAAGVAAGPVAFTGIDASIIPAGTVLARVDGARYLTTSELTIVAGSASGDVQAEVAGTAGAMDAGQQLSFVSPVTGVAAIATIAAGGLVGGAEEESDAELSARIYEVLRQPPTGGKASDYVTWAKSIPEVTRAWVYANWNGLGTVKVLFVCDGRADIIPEAGDVAAVTAKIEDERPVGADVTVEAPVADPLALTIALTPDTADVRAAVEASLRDLIAREAEPGGTLLISRIREAISIAGGESDHVLTSPTTNQTAAAGEIFTLGAITWS